MNLAAFLSFVIITSITPGPSNLLVMNEARKFGFTGALRFNGGILLGFIVLGTVSGLFTANLYHWIPVIEPYLKVLGALYLLYLSWQIIFSRTKDANQMKIKSSFIPGFLFQLVNVKSVIYFLTAMTTFILPYNDSLSDISWYLSLAIILGCLALLLWAVFGSAFKRLFTKYERLINPIMGLLLAYLAFTILI